MFFMEEGALLLDVLMFSCYYNPRPFLLYQIGELLLISYHTLNSSKGMLLFHPFRYADYKTPRFPCQFVTRGLTFISDRYGR